MDCASYNCELAACRMSKPNVSSNLQSPPPIRSKQWAPDHVRLACAAEEARRTLRGILTVLPVAQRAIVGQVCSALTCALKARGGRRTFPGKSQDGLAVHHAYRQNGLLDNF